MRDHKAIYLEVDVPETFKITESWQIPWVSQLIYAASTLSVTEPVINQTQKKVFAFLWKNKNDKIKRQVLYQPLFKDGLGLPCFRAAVKDLSLSWIGLGCATRKLLEASSQWFNP